MVRGSSHDVVPSIDDGTFTFSSPNVNPHRRTMGRRRYSVNTRCTNDTAIEPSPTADATRFTLPQRTSPTANTPGRLVSSRYGARRSGQLNADRSSRERSEPVLIKP